MYIEKQKPITLFDITRNNLFICKQDIDCINGIIKKDSLVYISTILMDGKNKPTIYDISDYDNIDSCNIFSCLNDQSRISITPENFNDYFKINEEATDIYNRIEKEYDSTFKHSLHFDELKDIFIEITLASSLIGIVTVAILYAKYPDKIRMMFIILLAIVAIFALIAFIMNMISGHICHKAYTAYIQQKPEIFRSIRN